MCVLEMSSIESNLNSIKADNCLNNWLVKMVEWSEMYRSLFFNLCVFTSDSSSATSF